MEKPNKEAAMKITKHAERRLRQRGFSKATIQIIMAHGRVQDATGNAIKVFFGRKESQQAIAELKNAIRLVSKAKNKCMIIKGDSILTAYQTL